MLANNSVKNVSATLWFCLHRSCKKCLTLWLRWLQCLVKHSVLSVFMDLRYAECVCLYYGLCVCSQTYKLKLNTREYNID